METYFIKGPNQFVLGLIHAALLFLHLLQAR